MKNKLTLNCSAQVNNAKQAGILQGLKLASLSRSIRKIIALGGFSLASSGVWAEAQINPNEIWLAEPAGILHGICAKDIDQDGDLDIFKIFKDVVFMLENIGTPVSPEFARFTPFATNLGNLKLNRLGLFGDCLIYDGDTSVDIDADGDLDLFSIPPFFNDRPIPFFSFFRNDGTTEHPVYVEKDPQEEFGLPFSPEFPFKIMFKDIDGDGDGDWDFWSNVDFEPIFFENTGSQEKAVFMQRNISPIEPMCEEGSGLGFIIDLNGCRSIYDI